MAFHAHERGQMPVVLLVLVGTLIAGALLFVMLDQAWGPIIDMAKNSSNSSTADAGISRAESWWGNWAMWVLILIFVFGIAGAAANSRRGP